MTRIVRETDDAFWTAPAVTDEQADRETHVPNHSPKTRTRRAKRKMLRQSHGRAEVLEERSLPMWERRMTEAEIAKTKREVPATKHMRSRSPSADWKTTPPVN